MWDHSVGMAAADRRQAVRSRPAHGEDVRGADLASSAARTDVPGKGATSAEVGVQTEPTFQLLEPGPAHAIIRNNVVR